MAEDLKHSFEEKTPAEVGLEDHPDEFQDLKANLAHRPPGLFETEMMDKFLIYLNIDDYEPDIIRRLKQYIDDTCGIDIKWENDSVLILATDINAIIAFRQKCSAYLKANLSVFNVSGIFQLADMLRDNDLKKSVLSFIEEEDKVVLNSEKWKDFAENHSEMAVDILTSLYRNVKQF